MKLFQYILLGAVKNEGVIEIENNSRVIDVIEEAGGLKDDANLENVNLAYTVQDGQKIYIPSVNDEEEKQVITSDVQMSNSGSTTVRVNINKANQIELENLPGVGPALANSIITYRKENGKFKNIEELKNVSGIGEAKFGKIKEYICV